MERRVEKPGGGITKEQSRDTGMAMVLLLLLTRVFIDRDGLILGAIALHVINMTAPQVYRYVAVIWLGLSHLLGTVVSTIVLSAIFVLVVTPVSAVRRFFGFDSLRLRTFKSGEESVMLERRHTYTPRDIERPY